MATKKAFVPTQEYRPLLAYWATFETFTVEEVTLMMKLIDPRLFLELPDWVDTDTSLETRMITSAARTGKLIAYFESAVGPNARTEVSVESLLTWLGNKGTYGWLVDGLREHRMLRPNTNAAAQHTTAVLAGSSSSAPAPLTTSQIAVCFEGLRSWTQPRWKKALGDKPLWLKECVAVAGARGVRETSWNPVRIGAALVRLGHVKQHVVRARFQTKESLKPWLKEWDLYEAQHFDTDTP